MKTEAEWIGQAKGMLKAELKRRAVSYDMLVDRLKTIGIDESAENLANKISRGKFTFVFVLQVLEAIGCKTIKLWTD